MILSLAEMTNVMENKKGRTRVRTYGAGVSSLKPWSFKPVKTVEALMSFRSPIEVYWILFLKIQRK
jgi:hypothetical protein